MNISIKEHIINNFKDDKKEDIKTAINETVEHYDEVTLPGLGVFMSLLWENSNEDEKDKITEKIKKTLEKELNN